MTAAHRVRRNFWILVAAAVVAVGVLSTGVRMTPGPLAGLITGLSATAAAAAIALAGRILVVSTRAGAPRPGRKLPERRLPGSKPS